MLERASALPGIQAIHTPRLRMQEDGGFSLIQLARPSKQAATLLGKLPETVGTAVERDGRVLMRIGTERCWIIGPRGDDAAATLSGQGLVTPLSSSRTRIAFEGAAARDVLARSAPLDFDAEAFTPGQFAMTGIHHTPAVIHCIGDQAFHIYALRTFALSIWEWLADAAEGLDARHP